jgi:CheY-like chemotaxis protein
MTTETQASQSTVLVVDDDEYSLDLARRQLGALGFSRVHVAGDGSEGLRVLDKSQAQPDFIICDIFMPNKDGIEFVAELANRSYGGGLILLSSGDSQMMAIARQIAVESGLNVLGAFAKPLQQDVLRQLLVG